MSSCPPFRAKAQIRRRRRIESRCPLSLPKTQTCRDRVRGSRVSGILSLPVVAHSFGALVALHALRGRGWVDSTQMLSAAVPNSLFEGKSALAGTDAAAAASGTNWTRVLEGKSGPVHNYFLPADDVLYFYRKSIAADNVSTLRSLRGISALGATGARDTSTTRPKNYKDSNYTQLLQTDARPRAKTRGTAMVRYSSAAEDNHSAWYSSPSTMRRIVDKLK